MKILILLLVGLLAFGGCSKKAVENRMDALGDQVEQGLNKIISSSGDLPIPLEQAVSVALSHAGVTREQITGLRTEYEADPGRQHYDIRFLMDGREYEYEISAADGSVLSFEKDD